jgi:hypothetical protein
MLVLATNEWRVPALVANQWLSLAKIALKMSLADRSRSLVANTSMCGEGIIVHLYILVRTTSPQFLPARVTFRVDLGIVGGLYNTRTGYLSGSH